MTERRIVLAIYWAAVTVAAACAGFLAAIPFTGTPAAVAGITAIAAVSWAGLTFAPDIRKDGRR